MDFTLVESKKKLKLKYEKPIPGQFMSKPQDNNKINTLTNTQETTNEKKILTQEEMMEVLISKIKSLDNIDIKTKYEE